MQPVLWTPRLAVGVESIDLQHRDLLELIGAVVEAAQSEEGAASLMGLLATLQENLAVHFADEEAEMRKAHYPATHRHQVEHNDLTRDLASLVAEYGREGLTPNIAARVRNRVGLSPVTHVRRADREFGRYLRGVYVRA